MCHDKVIEQTLDRGKIRPTLWAEQISDVRDPFPVRLGNSEVAIEHIFISFKIPS